MALQTIFMLQEKETSPVKFIVKRLLSFHIPFIFRVYHQICIKVIPQHGRNPMTGRKTNFETHLFTHQENNKFSGGYE